jgi:hypothetical protein
MIDFIRIRIVSRWTHNFVYAIMNNGGKRAGSDREGNGKGNTMGARWLQQKNLKIKRMRRAYLKKFSTKSSGVEKSFGFRNEQGDWVDTSFRARNKAAASFIDVALLAKYKFKSNDPTVLYAMSQGLHGDIFKETQLARIVQSTTAAGSLQGEERLVHYLINDKTFTELRLYMGQKECFFIGHRKTNNKNILYGSISYRDRERALLLHREDKLTWEFREEYDIPTSNSS